MKPLILYTRITEAGIEAFCWKLFFVDGVENVIMREEECKA